MTIAIFGANCVGKTTLANALARHIGARVYTGRDYLRLRKNADYAKAAFRELLANAVSGDDIIYVISEKEQLSLLPDGALRVLLFADIKTVKLRFAERMELPPGVPLPAPVAAWIERRHGRFDDVEHDIHLTSNNGNIDEMCGRILSSITAIKEGVPKC